MRHLHLHLLGQRVIGRGAVAALLLVALSLPLAASEQEGANDPVAVSEPIDRSLLPGPGESVDCNSDCILLALKTICRLKDLLQRDCPAQCEEACGEDRESRAELDCGVCTCYCD